MNKNFVLLIILAALVLGLLAPSLASLAEASGRVCLAPGTGLPGAWNMTLDRTMDPIMADHTAYQGDAGMETAVNNTACP